MQQPEERYYIRESLGHHWVVMDRETGVEVPGQRLPKQDAAGLAARYNDDWLTRLKQYIAQLNLKKE